MQKQQVSGEESAGGTRLVELSSGALRPRSLLLGLLLCLPGMTLSPVGAVEDSPEVLNLGVGGGAALSVEERGRWDGRRDLGEGIPGSGELSVLPGLEREAVSSRDEEQRFMERVLHRVSDQVWSAGMSLLTPDRLLATASAAREGTLSQHGSQALQGLQDQMLNAVIDAGVDELQRRAENQYLRNLEIRYQTPLSGRSGTFNVDALFSFLDQGRQSIFGQVGGLFGGDDSGFNFGLGYRRLLPNDRVLLGANFFYDYSTDAELQRVSLGLEAKSTALDLYFNWYHMIGTGNGVGDGFLSYTPDGLDIEVAGRLPSVPWVELSGRYYYWFLEDDDVYRARDGRGLSGFNYKLVLQPMPMFGLELQLDQPEKGAVEWGLGAQLKYRFGVPLQEQVRTRRVKAHAPLHRRFERVRREYKVLVRRRAGGPGVGAARPRLNFTRGNYVVSRDNPSFPITLRVENAALPAGTEPLVFSFEATQGAPLPSVMGQMTPTGQDYTLNFPANDGFDTANGSGTGASGIPYEVAYMVPAGGLDEDTVVIFGVIPGAAGGDTPDPDQVFRVTVRGGGLTASATVTLTDDEVKTVGIGGDSGTITGRAEMVNVQEPEGGSTQPATPAVLNVPLSLGSSDFSAADLPLQVQVKVSPAGSTAECAGDSPDYRVFADNVDGTVARDCTESDADGGYIYTYSVTSLDSPALKFQVLSDDLYKGKRTIRLSLQSVTGAGTGAEYAVAGSEQVINIYDAEDDLPELSLALFADTRKAAEATSPECPGAPTNLAQTLTEQEASGAQQEAVLRLCSSKPIVQDRRVGGTDLEVSLEESADSTAGREDFAVRGFDLTIPVTAGRDQTKSGDLPLSLAHDTVQEGEERLILDIPSAPGAAADCPTGSVGLSCYSGAGARYKLGSQVQVTVTVVDDDNATIRFPESGSEETVVESTSIDVKLVTASGRLYGSTADVWVMVSEACDERLTVTQDGTRIDQDTASTRWDIPFPAAAVEATFSLAFADDTVALNQECALRIVRNDDAPGAYTPAPEDAGGSTLVRLQDDDLPSIGLSDDAEQIQEGGSHEVTVTVTPNGADCSSIPSFGYTLTGLGSLQTLSCFGASCPLQLLADGRGNLQINCAITQTDPYNLTLTFTAPADDLSSGDRTVSLELLESPDSYNLIDPSSFTLDVQDNDMVSFGFASSALTVSEGAARREVALTEGSMPTVDLQIPVTVEVNPAGAGDRLNFFSADDQSMVLQPCQESFVGNGWCRDGANLELQIKGSTAENFPPRLWVSASQDDDEKNEVFTLRIQGDTDTESRWTVPSTSAEITISTADNEAISSVYLGDLPSLVEPATGTGSADILVRVAGLNSSNCPSGESLEIGYSVDETTSTATASDDYTLPSSPLTVACPSGMESETTGTISIQLSADQVAEGEEDLAFRLSGPAAGVLSYQLGSPASGTLTILDPDPTSGGPRVFISNRTASPLRLSEGGDAQEVTFRIQPISSTARTIQLSLIVSSTGAADVFDGSTADLVAFSATPTCGTTNYIALVPVSFPANTDTASAYMCAFDDDLVEGPESLNLLLAARTNYQLSSATDKTQRAVTIVDDDNNQLPVIYVGEADPVRLAEGSTASTTVTARVNAASSTTLDLNYNLGAPDAPAADKADADDISAGASQECTSEAATDTAASYYACTRSGVSSDADIEITFSVFDDEIDEDSEDLTFSIRDSASYLAATGASEATLSITDNDDILVRFTAPDVPAGSQLYYDDAREGRHLPINYGYEGTLGPNVQRRVSLQIADTEAECGVPDDGEGAAEAGTLPGSPTFAVRGNNNDYQLGSEEAAASPVFPFGDSVNFNFGPAREGNQQGTDPGRFYVRVRDDPDSESSEYICLRFQALSALDAADVNTENDRYLLRVPANDLPSVQIGRTSSEEPMLLGGGSSTPCSVDRSTNIADCKSLYEGNPSPPASAAGNSSITSGLEVVGGTRSVSGNSFSFCVSPQASSGDPGIEIRLTNLNNNSESIAALRQETGECPAGNSRYLADVGTSSRNYTLAVRPLRNNVMSTTDAGAIRDFAVSVEPSLEDYTVGGVSQVQLTVVDDDLLVSSGLSANTLEEGTGENVTGSVNFTLTFRDNTAAAGTTSARTRTVPVRLRLVGGATEATFTEDYKLLLDNPEGGAQTEITSGQMVNGDLVLDLGFTMGAGSVEATRVIAIDVVADSSDEPDETVILQVLEELDELGGQGTNRSYRIMGESTHTLTITDDDGPVALNLVVGDPVPISDPVGEGESPGYTLAVNINCRDGSVGEECGDQTDVPVYLFFKDPERGSGRARYGAGAGDYRAFLSGANLADRVQGQNYVKVGQFAQLVMGLQSTPVDLIVATETDNLFEGTEVMVFQLCVGGVSNGVCDNPLFPENDDYSLSVFDDEKDLPTLRINRPQRGSTPGSLYLDVRPPSPTTPTLEATSSNIVLSFSVTQAVPGTADISDLMLVPPPPSVETRMVGFDVLEGREAFTLTIMQPGGLSFANGTFFEFPSLCDRLTSGTTINWTTGTFDHYKVDSTAGSYTCPSQ